MFGADADVVSYLIRKFPGAAKKVDKLNMLPLHIACDSDVGIDAPNVSVIEVLAKGYPEACLSQTNEGNTPVVISIARKVPLQVVVVLIKACPESLSTRDQQNQIPLHTAVTAKATIDMIRFLILTYPSALIAKNDKNETPYDLAVKFGLDSDILELLEPPDTLKKL